MDSDGDLEEPIIFKEITARPERRAEKKEVMKIGPRFDG